MVRMLCGEFVAALGFEQLQPAILLEAGITTCHTESRTKWNPLLMRLWAYFRYTSTLFETRKE